MKWREMAQKIGMVLLVSAFALCFALAVWRLSDGHESLVWNREMALSERYNLLAEQLRQGETTGSEEVYEFVLQSAENEATTQAHFS